ncbi:hypothetical protein VP01_3096g1 [Puccinia sorghi]|uniref:Retrovirus-related Pol polyprotein from transposon TNT 1-94-like beta-barrel domain-containing protein n=1 Tax=Puccinia sorghi TaxID=27349 RepID=A0A0L6UZI0_9BASI|nr:hypothetical protein VP01_3096g1 [Puccinia sorghi]
MENINSTILKTTIEAIPTLTKENLSSWSTGITALFKLGGVKTQMLEGVPPLEDKDNTTLCAIILSKLSTSTQSNVVTSENEDNAQLLWKAILKRFISSEPSNRARVYNHFQNITFDYSNIEKFITKVRCAIVKMEDVGIDIPEDIITYDLIKRLPSSLENIKQSITHSRNGKDIKPATLLDHLEIHLNKLKVTAANKGEVLATSMYTSDEQKCLSGRHNPLSKTHTKEKCWAIHPEQRITFLKKKEEHQVGSFSTYSSVQPSVFILDSGSSSHMVSNRKLFLTLDEDKGGLFNTSCGMSTIQIKGKGSVKLKFKDHFIVFHNVLFVPNMTFNVLSLRLLVLDQCNINFQPNHFTITRNNVPFLDGCYHNNIPVLELNCEPSQHESHLSEAELLHKSLGHASEECKSCAVVKITKASFKHQSSMASKPFEKLHLDLVGPISPISYKHHKYILTIVDDSKRVDYGNLTVEPKPKSREPAILNPVKDDESSKEEIVVKEEYELDDGDTEHLSANDDSNPKDLDVAESLVPAASNPAIASYNSSGWINAINNELDNIKKHHVWIDQHKEPANSQFVNLM